MEDIIITTWGELWQQQQQRRAILPQCESFAIGRLRPGTRQPPFQEPSLPQRQQQLLLLHQAPVEILLLSDNLRRPVSHLLLRGIEVLLLRRRRRLLFAIRLQLQGVLAASILLQMLRNDLCLLRDDGHGLLHPRGVQQKEVWPVSSLILWELLLLLVDGDLNSGHP